MYVLGVCFSPSPPTPTHHTHTHHTHTHTRSLSPSLRNKYWGNSTASVVSSFCEPQFFHFNTTNRAWDDPGLVGDMCGALHNAMTGGSGGAAPRDVVLITHSMANLVIAQGIVKQRDGCKDFATAGAPLSHGKVAWVSSQPPLYGTPVGNTCVNLCRVRLPLPLSLPPPSPSPSYFFSLPLTRFVRLRCALTPSLFFLLFGKFPPFFFRSGGTDASSLRALFVSPHLSSPHVTSPHLTSPLLSS